jgi:ABC-type transporter MlaC component
MQKKIKMLFTALVTTALMGSSIVNFAHADETVKEKVTEARKDTKRAMKKSARKVKDETCEMVNGKMKCMGKKIKHGAQNVGDKIEDAVD